MQATAWYEQEALRLYLAEKHMKAGDQAEALAKLHGEQDNAIP